MADMNSDLVPLRIVCVSDTHNDDSTADVPSSDIFIHAGDMTDRGTLEELTAAFNWISKVPSPIKIVVPGMFNAADVGIPFESLYVRLRVNASR